MDGRVVNPSWIDTHAHLNDERFNDRLEETVSRARAAGVAAILVVGIDVSSSERAVALAERDALLHAVVGLQPNSLADARPGDWERIVELSRHPRVVALGETGLDRYWDRAPFDLQQEYFKRHLLHCHESGLPVVIHCREAEADTVALLESVRKETGRPMAGVMHSYTGDRETAARCVELGLHVSFAGMVTFKKNDVLRDVALSVPLDRLLIETDSPYLSPEPVRGRPNEPAHVIHTGASLARVCGLSVEEFARVTTANARRLFRLPESPEAA